LPPPKIVAVFRAELGLQTHGEPIPFDDIDLPIEQAQRFIGRGQENTCGI
jgi:hypothetical protein